MTVKNEGIYGDIPQTARPGGRQVWQVQIIKKGFPRQYRTFNSKTAAVRWALDIESEMAEGVFVSRAEAERTTLGEAPGRYLAEITPRKKASTIARERNRIRVLRADPLAERVLAGIRGADVADFVRDREAEGLGANAIRLDLALLSHVFTVAGSVWGMESLGNPVQRIRGHRPKIPQGRNRRLIGDEHARLLAAAKNYRGEAPRVEGDIAPLITWAIETAMRRSEIVAMRWEHLDRTAIDSHGKKAPVLLIPETKNGTSRRVPLSKAALVVLDGLPRRIDGRVWGVRPDWITRAFGLVCKAAGIEGLTFHDLRHEAASRLGERGFSPMEVAAITGH